ncbi:MAG: hypothetical protein IKS90_06580 [Clostridia bacterium]|nr:hypothetical protein [Clostridia bacterium]
MFGKKTKELLKQIEEKNNEIEALRAQLNEKQALLDANIDELNKAKNETESVKKELEGIKRTVAEFESRQEAIASAMTEATNMKERILKEAREEAERLESEGKKRREEFIEEGRIVCEKAQANAEKLLKEAQEKADEEDQRAKRAAESILNDAQSAADKLIEDARSASKGILDEADEGVRARTAQLEELNELIRERARLALKDAEYYADTLDSVSVRGKIAAASKKAAAKPETKPAEKANADKPQKNTGGNPELGRKYKDAAALMRSIYSIEGRDLPTDEATSEKASEASEGFSMPVDPDFADIIADILGNGESGEK